MPQRRSRSKMEGGTDPLKWCVSSLCDGGNGEGKRTKERKSGKYGNRATNAEVENGESLHPPIFLTTHHQP